MNADDDFPSPDELEDDLAKAKEKAIQELSNVELLLTVIHEAEKRILLAEEELAAVKKIAESGEFHPNHPIYNTLMGGLLRDRRR